MYFESFTDLIQMGRHGAYVWSAYGISLLLLLSNIWWARRNNRNVREDIHRIIRREAARKKSESP